MTYSIALKVSIDACTSDLKHAVNEMLYNLLLYSSGFTYAFSPIDHGSSGWEQMDIFSIISGNPDPVPGIRKQILLYAPGSGGLPTYIDALNLLGRININSIFSSDALMVVDRKRMISEAYKPSYIVRAHISLKKNLPLIVYDDISSPEKALIKIFPQEIKIDSSLYECKELKAYADILVEHLVPLSIAIFHSGIHRFKQAYNQIAFQTLVYYTYLLLLAGNSLNRSYGLNRLIEYATVLQSIIVADTYSWIPYTWIIKRGAYGTEFLYSVASLAIIELLKHYDQIASNYSLNYLTDYAISMFNRIEVTYFKRAVNYYRQYNRGKTIDLGELIGGIHEVVVDTLCEVYKLDRYGKVGSGIHETLIARPKRIYDRLRNNCRREYESLFNTATEQTSILLLGVLLDIFRVNKIYLLYTPQTLTQVLLLKTLIKSFRRISVGGERMCSVGIKNIKYVPIPSTEPYICEEIIDYLLLRTNLDKAVFVLQGASTTIIPIYMKLLEKGISNNNIFII